MAKTVVFQKQFFFLVCVWGIKKEQTKFFLMIGKRQHQFWPLCTLIILTIRR